MRSGCAIAPSWRAVSYSFLITAILGCSTFLGNCGGSSKQAPPVDVQVSPAAATISVNSSVDLQASGSSLVKYTNLYWEVQEEDLSCTTELLPPQPPSFPCPSGWLWEEMPVAPVPRINATYYSPSQPGTYHVLAIVETPNGSNGQAISTITVTP